MAPGVQVVTTDLTGIDGRDPGPINGRFNGTSAATPFVSATAALVLVGAKQSDANGTFVRFCR